MPRFRKKKGGKERKRKDKKENKDENKEHVQKEYSQGGWVTDRTNAAFEEYYKEQNIIPDEEWPQLLAAMQQPLPVTYRVSGVGAEAEEVLDRMKSIINSCFSEDTIEWEGEIIPKPQPIPWYPEDRAWKIKGSRRAVRRVEQLQAIHKWLKDEQDAGKITRQEVVSMVPCFFLDVLPEHKVLDMCAAPGSKTTQLLDMLHAADNLSALAPPRGFVVGNDADWYRCYMLVHQTKRLATPNFVITNHEGQGFPNLKTGAGEAVKFDRILCDVPCSGDGTFRKNVMLWKNWRAKSGQALHRLQKLIAFRGCAMLAVGGYMVYSTCSLNPLENESVVASILEHHAGEFELVDVSDRLPALVRRPGLTTWKVKFGDNYLTDISDEELATKPSFARTMFPRTQEAAAAMHLERCVRIYPHLQDSGGFFVALLKRVAPTRPAASTPEPSSPVQEPPTKKAKLMPENGTSEEEKKPEVPGEEAKFRPGGKADGKTTKQKSEEPFIMSAPKEEQIALLRDFFGISDAFPFHDLLVRSEKDVAKNYYLVAPGVRQLFECDMACKWKLINCGLRVFVKHPAPEAGINYRLAQEAIHWMLPFMSDRRVIKVSFADFIALCSHIGGKYKGLHRFSPELQQRLETYQVGSMVFVFDPRANVLTPDEQAEARGLFIYSPIHLCAWRGRNSISLFINKNEMEYLQGRLGLERKGFEDDSQKKPPAATEIAQENQEQ